MRAWLPLAEATLSMVAHHLPSPITAATARVPHLTRAAALPPDALAALPAAARATLARGRVALAASDASATAPVVIYISKMIAVPAGAVPRLPGEAPPADAHAEEFLAFGRVFSGVVREGMRVQVLSAAYTPLRPDQHRCDAPRYRSGHRAEPATPPFHRLQSAAHRAHLRACRQHASVTGVYLMMGRALERLQAVPAGNVLALRGLADAILKSATVCSGPAAFPLAAVQHQAEAIVQVRCARSCGRAWPDCKAHVAPPYPHPWVLSSTGESGMATVCSGCAHGRRMRAGACRWRSSPRCHTSCRSLRRACACSTAPTPLCACPSRRTLASGFWGPRARSTSRRASKTCASALRASSSPCRRRWWVSRSLWCILRRCPTAPLRVRLVVFFSSLARCVSPLMWLVVDCARAAAKAYCVQQWRTAEVHCA